MEPDRPTDAGPLRNTGLNARRRALLAVAQAVISLGLLVWLFAQPGFRDEVAAALSAPHPWWLVGGFLLAGVSHALCLARWGIFVRVVGLRVAPGLLVRAFFSGLFVNIFLPGGAGGDVARVAWLRGAGCDLGRAALSVVIDRLCGAVSLTVLAAVLVVPRAPWASGNAMLAGAFTGLAVYLGALAAFLAVAFAFSLHPGRLPGWWRRRAWLVEIAEAFAQTAVRWRASVAAVGVSCAMLLAYFAVFLCAARSVGLEVPAADFLMLMPVIDVAAALPVGLGGLGVRETAMAFLLSQWGVAAGTAVAVSLTGYILSTLWALPGALAGIWSSSSDER